MSAARIYDLTARCTGEQCLVSRAELGAILRVEPSYVDWVLQCDGVFINADWTVRRGPISANTSFKGTAHDHNAD